MNIRSHFYDPVSEPILYNIAKNFETFLGEFTGSKENVRECFIFMNKFITYGGENQQILGINFFGEEVLTNQRKQIGNILFSHILKEDGTAYSHATFEQKTSVNISVDKYDSLRRICQDTLENVNNLQREPFQGKKTSDLITFCNRFRKGSKPFRKILVGPKKMVIPRHIATYAGSTETIIGLEMSRHLGGFWGFNFLNNDLRVFLFKMQSGLLGLNNRVAHFIQDHSPICRGGRKVRLIDLSIPIRSSDFIGRYNRLMSSSDFCIGRLCRFVLSSDSLIGQSCFLVLSSDFCIWRLCRPVLSKKSLYRCFIC